MFSFLRYIKAIKQSTRKTTEFSRQTNDAIVDPLRPKYQPEQQFWRKHFPFFSLNILLLTGAFLLPIEMMQPQRAFAASCSTGVINRTSSPVFYIDTGITPRVVGNYVSYTITNTSGSAYADLWVKLESFSGGRITLAPGETGIAHVGSLANGASKTVFFYLANTAGTGDTLTAQSHTVSLYSTRPDLASSSICGNPFSQTVEETIKALANKVTAVVAGPNPPELGGIVTITATGDTGTIGNAGIFAPTPASLADWPANAYKLVGTQITFTGGNTGTFNNILYKSGLNSQDTSYEIIYTFVAVGATTAPTSVTPVTQISSGTQIKHNDTSGTSLLAILPTSNKVTLTKSVSSTALPVGGTVTYTITLNNTGAVATTLDDIIDILPSSPSNASYVSGSAKFNNSPIPDPNISGQTLTFLGLFTVPAGGTRTLTYQATIPNTTGTYTNSAIGHIGSTQIDTTLTTADNIPATANVSVGPLPVTVSGTVFNDTDRSKVQNGSEVLVNMTGLNAVLVNTTTGLVVAQTTVTSGAFSFSNVTANTNYTVQITTATATVGSVPPAITLPNWVSTGENLGGNIDGTVDSKLSVAVTTSNVTGANFGIVGSNPNVLLVKRITGINGLPRKLDGTSLVGYEHLDAYDNNFISIPTRSLITDPQKDTDKWPDTTSTSETNTVSTFLIGASNGGTVKPNDSIEYTIYFLSAGDSPANNVLFCDRVPANVTFSPNTFTTTTTNPSGVARGIAVQIGSTIDYRTNAGDSDDGQYFPPGIEPSTVYPNINCGKSTTGQALPNDNGAIVVNLRNRPNATGVLADDRAAGAYGFVRFRCQVK